MQKNIMLFVCIALVMLLLLAPTIVLACDGDGNGPEYHEGYVHVYRKGKGPENHGSQGCPCYPKLCPPCPPVP
jgi:hypothetical protein